jgi:hypothetical protein
MNAQQKSIVIDEKLAENSEKFKVKMGVQWMGKIFNYKFGPYEVLDSKSGWTTTTAKSKFFSSKLESRSDQKFSFELGDKSKDTAFVNVLFTITTEEIQAIEITPGFYIMPGDLNSENDENFMAFIFTASNPDDVWVLVMQKSDLNGEEHLNDAFLTNRQRTIDIVPANSNLNEDDFRTYKALGYAFVEKENTVGAMQYYGGGALGYNKNIFWLGSDLDKQFKLILAAAMTSLLQKEMIMFESMDE